MVEAHNFLFDGKKSKQKRFFPEIADLHFYFQSSDRMSTSDDSIDMDQPPRMRSTSVSEMMMKLSTSTTSPSGPTDGTTIVECLLDVLCVKHSSKPGGLTIYKDSLRTNIIGELSLKEFLKDNQAKNPTVRTAYAEVQEINRVSYRSLYFTTKIDKRQSYG